MLPSSRHPLSLAIAKAIEPTVAGMNHSQVDVQLLETVLDGIRNIKDRKPTRNKEPTTPIIIRDFYSRLAIRPIRYNGRQECKLHRNSMNRRTWR